MHANCSKADYAISPVIGGLWGKRMVMHRKTEERQEQEKLQERKKVRNQLRVE